MQSSATSSCPTNTGVSPREMTCRPRCKRVRLASGENPEEVQSDSSRASSSSNEDECEDISSRTRLPQRKESISSKKSLRQFAIAFPEVVQPVVSNIGLQRGGSQSFEIPRTSPTSNEHGARFSERDFVLSPLSLLYNVPEDLNEK